MNGKGLISGGVVIVILALGGGAAFAAQQEAEEGTPIEGGSIPAPAGSGEEHGATPATSQNEAAEEEAEAAKGLEKLTGVDRTAAKKAALGAVSGEAREIELENEGGFVVYEVEVAGNDGKLHEVVVDAGNGEVLGQEVEEGRIRNRR